MRPAGQRTRQLSGFAIILIATAIAGVASYAVTILVPNRIGLAEYAIFAVFWSSIYLVVGALGGIQLEVTRATVVAPLGSFRSTSRASRFGIIAGILVFVTIVATAPLWKRSVFPVEGWNLVWPLAVGAASFVMVAVLAGSLYGVMAWMPLALMISVDSLLRLVSLSITLILTRDIVALAWAVAVPFPVALLVLWPVIRRSMVCRSKLDVGYGALSWNVARTVVAASATAVMVSGFPLLLGLTSGTESRGVLGMFIVAITLTRAPLIIVAMSLQSYLIVHFRDDTSRFWRHFLGILGLTTTAGALLAAAGWRVGPVVYHFLFPDKLQPDGPFFAILVGSSVLVAALCITAPAVLALSNHRIYSIGWVGAALATIVSLVLPLDFASRTITALLVGPSVGLVIHGGFLAFDRLRERRDELA